MKATFDLLIITCSSDQAITIYRRQVDYTKSNVARFVNSEYFLIDQKEYRKASKQVKVVDIQTIEHIGNELVNINAKLFINKVTTTYVFINIQDEKQSYLKAWEISIPVDESSKHGDDNHIMINDIS